MLSSPSVNERARAGARVGASFAMYVGLFMVFTVIYKTARWLAEPADATAPLANAGTVIDIERSLGIFIEPEMQRWVQDAGIEPISTWFYTTAHQPGYVAFFIALFFLGRSIFPFVWRWFWVTSGLAVLGFWFFPLAPPRLVPSLGLDDPTHTALELGGTTSWFINSDFRNIYAAMPSLHVGYPILFAAVIFYALRGRRLRWAAWLWPLVMGWATVASANHYFLDIVGGAAVVAVGAALTTLIWPALPRPWLAEPQIAAERSSPASSSSRSLLWRR